MATDREIAVKQARVMSGAPLRLAFTGRLEKMKGADDLIAIAAALDRAGKDFSLDVFGSGSLTSEMESALNHPAAGALRRKVRINAPVDFNRELVPWMRSRSICSFVATASPIPHAPTSKRWDAVYRL